MVSTFLRFRSALRPYAPALALGSLLVVTVAAADVAGPWPLKIVVDNVLKGKPLGGGPGGLLAPLAGLHRDALLGAAIGLLLAFVTAGALADYASTRVLNGIGERLTADIRSAIFAHLQRQSLSFHDRQRVGDLTTRITADVDYVQEMLVASLSVLLPNLAVLLGIAAVMLAVDATFALVALAVAPFLFVAIFLQTRRIKEASRRARRLESDVAALAAETLASIRVVQAYTGEPRQFDVFRERNLSRLAAGLDVVGAQARLSPLVDILTACGTALVLWYGARRVSSGEMSLGLLLVFLTYLAQFYRPMRNLSKLASVVSRGQASADRVHEILSADVRVVERADAAPAPSLRGAVSVRSVTFGYEPSHPVLHDLCVDLQPGETVALVGVSGAGKSTVASLVPRLYDPWAGEVLLDGLDVRGFTLASLRAQIALVLQDSILFRGSILDNIAYGRVGATAEQVLAAAEAAYVDEFVRELPEGYETVVAEKGTTLSGGQRQRIAIARALVRDAPVVILDEPTSGLDALSERYVLKGLERLMAGRTVLLIAHRLSTLQRADRIYVLDAGRVVDEGTHDDLTNRPGLYRRMKAAFAGE
jgi:ATP-binding cassette, subfamily B, bacterial